MSFFPLRKQKQVNELPVNDDKILNEFKEILENNFDKFKSNFNVIFKTNLMEGLQEFSQLTEDITKLNEKISKLKKEKEALEDENVKAKKNLELQELELKHLVKLKEERDALTIERKEIELEKKFQTKEIELIKNNFTRIEEIIEKYSKDTVGLYNNLMKVLPNVNLEITKDISK